MGLMSTFDKIANTDAAHTKTQLFPPHNDSAALMHFDNQKNARLELKIGCDASSCASNKFP
jgi:hypothetical protein